MEADAGNSRKLTNEQQQQQQQQQTLEFIGNLREIEGIRMKQNIHDSALTEEEDSAAAAVCLDGAKCDETPPPGDDVAPDLDEGVDNTRDPDYVEERFRVDRRKLEQLIQASEDEEENAEEFFKKIMSETNTHIAWPSKLKIGAKSKKDPHIKVSGHKDSVLEAKNRILAILDTKSLRVTLKMDVSHTEHSHVIGKSGHNIKRVMQETGCHIHFPDSNRNTLAEKSNQVSIAGQCDGVELARTRIRELLPLVFMFEVPMTGPNQTNIDSNSAVIQNIQHHYGVSINIKTHHQVFMKTVIVRGSVYNSKSVKKVAAMVFELLTGRIGETFGVSMLLDIAAQHHLFIIGHGGANINRIMQHTGATIHFPDPATTEPQRRGTVCITGTMTSVFLARRQLLGCLPLVLMFDLKEDIEVDQGLLSQLMEQLDVFISIKPKPKQTTKSVIVKTIESNTQNVYEARRRILGLTREATPYELKDEVSSVLGDQSFDLLGYQNRNKSGNIGLDIMSGSKIVQTMEPRPSSVTNAPSLKNPGYRQMMMFPLQHHTRHQSTLVCPPSYAAPPFCYMPPYGPQPQEWSPYSPGHRLPPSHQQHPHIPVSFPVTPNQRSNVPNCNEDLILHMTSSLSMSQMSPFSPANVNGFTCPQPSISPGAFSAAATLHTPQPYTAEAGCSHSSLLYPLQSSASSSSSPSTISSSALYHHPLCQQYSVHDGTFPMMPDQSNDVYSSTLMTNPTLVDNNATQVRYRPAPVNGSVYATVTKEPLDDERHDLLEENRQRTFLVQNGDMERDGDFCESDSSSELSNGSKAPGSNRPMISVNNCQFEGGSLLLNDIDYEQMKVLASKAMLKKPVGESRIPTDYWAGLGFSRSMPASEIRERLNLNDSGYDGPQMTTPYEDVEEDSETWKNAVNSGNPTDSRDNLMNFVSQLSAHCREMSLQQDGCNIGQIDGCHQMNNKSSSIWQPLNEEQTDRVAIADTELSLLFSEMGLGKYAELFKQQEIDMQTFVTLTDQDLKDLGINTFGARRKMLLAIADLNKRQSLLPPPPGLPNPFRDAGIIRRHDIVSQSVRW